MDKVADPTAADQHTYLLRLYFGDDHDPITCCINRAYRDLNRTMHGFSAVAEGEGLRTQASKVLRSFLSGLPELPAAAIGQPEFDALHREVCQKLCSIFRVRPGKFRKFYVGQAQKWINMSLKYVYVFGEVRLPGYAPFYRLAHIPLDNIILGRLRERYPAVPRLSTPWSRITDYDEYMKLQESIRLTFTGSAPLAVEFALWLDSNSERTGEDPTNLP